MPFVDGESLRDLLQREKQLPIAEALHLAGEVASALDYAHRRGVIHRNIKPENILLHDGTALVADFGIALAVSSAGRERMTETGVSLGTPHYMSPEQAMSERDITPRSDVCALGCVLYEMLVGEPPFTGPTAQSIVAKVMTDEPRPPSQLRKPVSLAVDRVALTALSKLPADRQASAAVFSEKLIAAGQNRTGTSPSTPPIQRARPAVGRAAMWVALRAVVGAVLVFFALRGWGTPKAGASTFRRSRIRERRRVRRFLPMGDLSPTSNAGATTRRHAAGAGTSCSRRSVPYQQSRSSATRSSSTRHAGRQMAP